jgi:hypothetical protein
MARQPKPMAAGKPARVEMKLVPDQNLELPYPRMYSNYVSIHSSPFDFTLRFCDALPLYEKPKATAGGSLENKIPIKAEIIIPIKVFPELIKAMQIHYDRYLKIYVKDQGDEKKE